jgi:hypothetical protein
MSEEQINPQEDDVEAHRLARSADEDPEKLVARDEDDDVEAHHWKAGPEKFAEGPDRFAEKFSE